MRTVIDSILQSEDLPTPPGVAVRLLELYSQPEVEIGEMANVIGADPSLSARLIEYCNSPMLARDKPTANIRQAIVVLGMRAVKILALSFSLVHTTSSKETGFDYDAFWARSLATAVASKTFAINNGRFGDEEFLLGLMMCVGRVGLAHTFPSRYSELAVLARESGEPIEQLEKGEWSINHYEVSAKLMEHWRFPTELVEQVQAIGDGCENLDEASQQVQILMLAQQVVAILFDTDLPSESIELTKKMAEKWLGLDAEVFAEVFDDAAESWSEFAKLLKYEAAEAQTFEQLERRALKGIAQLSMGLYAENTVMNQQNAMLKVSATVDPLTGLKNRRAYDDDAMSEWERSNRTQRPLAIMMIDIDHFKSVNDTHGHAIGDRALVEVANTLKGNVRDYDLVYRFGGEEFVVLVPECDPEAAINAANRFREAIAGREIQLDTGILKITASFGVAISQPPKSVPLSELLEEADKLLYQAKKEGRNRVCSSHTSDTAMMPDITMPNDGSVSQQSST